MEWYDWWFLALLWLVVSGWIASKLGKFAKNADEQEERIFRDELNKRRIRRNELSHSGGDDNALLHRDLREE